MKRIIHRIVLAAAAAGMVACGKGMDTDQGTTQNPTLETIAQRRSVRSYTSQRVSQDTIELLLRSAMAAPSSKDRRPWHFVVVDDRATLDTLAERLPYAPMLAHVPHALVVCGDSEVSASWFLDCAAATENFLLAVQAMELAAVWTGVYPSEHRVSVVRGVLGLPEYVVPLSLIPVGYPAESPKPKDKWKPENVHRNGWN